MALPGIYPREMKIYVYTKVIVYSTFIFNNLKMETTKMSLNSWMSLKNISIQ